MIYSYKLSGEPLVDLKLIMNNNFILEYICSAFDLFVEVEYNLIIWNISVYLDDVQMGV